MSVNTYQTSEMVPPVLVKGAPPANPPINRQTIMVPMFGARAMGSWKMKRMNHEMMYTGCLPKYSERGARRTCGHDALDHILLWILVCKSNIPVRWQTRGHTWTSTAS